MVWLSKSGNSSAILKFSLIGLMTTLASMQFISSLRLRFINVINLILCKAVARILVMEKMWGQWIIFKYTL